MSVAIVVVSHSEPLARAAVALAGEMLQGGEVRVEVAAGLDDGSGGFEVGTDAMRIKEAVEACAAADGVLVLVDLGSAVMSAEMALDFLDDPTLRDRVTISPAPLVEGLVVATVAAAGGATLAEVAAEALDATAAKAAHLADPPEMHADPPAMQADPPAVSGRFTVRNPHGLHARPAARLVQEVRCLGADVELVNLTTGAGPEPGSSMIRVAVLGAAQGHEVEVRARTQEAVDAVLALAERGFDESIESFEPFETPPRPSGAPQEPGAAGAPREPEASGAPRADAPRGASPGVVVGPVRRLVSAPLEVDDAAGSVEDEAGRLDAALADARGEIEATHRALRHTAEAEIFEAHLALLDDDTLRGRARALVAAGRSAPRAWADAVAEVHDEWAALDDPYLRERAADVDAVGQQVLRALTGAAPPAMPAPGVLLADDLTPADTSALDLALVQGVVLAGGSATSHAAILARARDVPLVVGAGDLVRAAPDGVTVALDGGTGEVHVDPSDAVLEDFERRAAAEREQRRTALDATQAPAVTTDGATVVVGANLGSVADAELARASGADKAGLVRTEFLFLGRDDAPDEDEQAATYAAVAAALDRRVTLRTLDVGGDKPLPYVAAPAEDNPFLGVRGVRLSLRHPDLLRTQLAAMVRAAAGAEVEVMVPMVTDPAEMDAVRALLPEGASLRLGMMVEVPSAALKLPAFVGHVDFVSIGTNDLTQYAVAAERGNPGVAELGDPLDPGVLQLVERVVASGLPTGVCGEAAADPAGVPLLLGLGVRELSVAPPAVPRVKALVRTLDTAACAELAREAMRLPDAATVRRLVEGA